MHDTTPEMLHEHLMNRLDTSKRMKFNTNSVLTTLLNNIKKYTVNKIVKCMLCIVYVINIFKLIK